MKITPILYSAAMARAKVAGIKTNTRRLRGLGTINRNPDNWILESEPNGELFYWRSPSSALGHIVRNPFGKPGDILYGKEAFSIDWHTTGGLSQGIGGGMLGPEDRNTVLTVIVGGKYTADGSTFQKTLTPDEADKFRKWKRKKGGHSSLFMFRSLSRIVDEIVEVRVERLQDILADECIAEGIDRQPSVRWPGRTVYRDYLAPKDDYDQWFETPRQSYKSLWESINGPGSWDLNPFVWVVVTKPFTGELPK